MLLVNYRRGFAKILVFSCRQTLTLGFLMTETAQYKKSVTLTARKFVRDSGHL